MFPAFLVGLVAVSLLVAILIQQNSVKKASLSTSAPNVRTLKLKGAVHLVIDVPLKLNLAIDKNSRWKSMLANSALFPQPPSGDAEFDDMFSLTAYRKDVIAALQTAGGLRKSLMQLARETPSFSSIRISRRGLTLALAGQLGEDKLGPIRSKFAALAPALLKPFEMLSPDTAKEACAYTFDESATAFAIFSLIPLFAIAFVYDQPAISSDFPLPQMLSLTGAFLVMHLALLFAMTTQGVPRKRGILGVLMMSFIFIIACPPLVRGVNMLSQGDVTTETVTVAALSQHTAKKGRSHFYIQLKDRPAHLAFASGALNLYLEISGTLYAKLEDQSVHPGSKLEIEESSGLLGLPYVVDARVR